MLAKAEVDALSSKDPDYLAGADAESNHHYQQALAFYEKAVARGDVQAAFAQGLIYHHGNGVPQDKARAFALLRKAAEGGVMGAQNMLGIYYDDGEGGIARNPQEAEKWYALAVGQYDLHGLRNYGNFLVKKSPRGDPDFERGLGYLQQAAGMGLHAAQADLAGYLSRDKPAAALFWREFAAASGDAEYQFQLAAQLRSGDKPLRDDARARRIFAALAKEGHQQAQTELAVMLEYGLGGDKDQAQALALFEKSAKQGSLVAQMRLARFYLYGNVVKEDNKKAAELLREPADHDVVYASFLLGNLYRFGKGVEQDTQKARMYYERAAAGGVVDAQAALGDLFYGS
jgi:TPR repeat protein